MSNENSNDLPDSIRPYLNEIAERLWGERAAVMVGAGFSKNAGTGFPDWNQLGDLFYEKAHGRKPSAVQQKYMNVLRLAEEAQAAIGRPALENLIRFNIKDLDSAPSALHVSLLELPWVDVFTTNYDTLLERASAKVVTRRYEPVINKEDVPYAAKPRIVKLHGSFPSERPFIITEEDYRRYPHEYAPFVNTVQQSLLENTFCLIGFSGDDPNFLQWIGWIRDNLGRDKTQKIYLIGVFDLSAARLQLIAQRGIVVVDLSCCQGIEKHDHKKAMEKFFKYVWSRKPDALNWPSGEQTDCPRTSRGLPGDEESCAEETQKITREWREHRAKYPGWLILPHDTRENLWRHTKYWIGFHPKFEKKHAGLDILYAFELIWRLEHCLQPLFNTMPEFCERVLGKYWPFPSGEAGKNCLFRVGQEVDQALPWDEIRHAWLAIALALLRSYREDGQLEKWERTKEQIERLKHHLSPEQQEFVHYENFLFRLFCLDLPKAKQCLEEWNFNEAEPYWMVKRAAALAEIGLFDGVEEQIKLSLNETKKRARKPPQEFCYLAGSNEAYQMFILKHFINVQHFFREIIATSTEEELIKEGLLDKWQSDRQNKKIENQKNTAVNTTGESRSFDDNWNDLVKNRNGTRQNEWNSRLQDVRRNQREMESQKENARWNELKSSQIDPWNELKIFRLILENNPAPKKAIKIAARYDIGEFNRTLHLFGSDEDGIQAYSFLRFCEEIGLPHKIRNCTLAKETVISSLSLIFRSDFFWANATLFRLGDNDSIEKLLDRETISRVTADEANQKIQKYLEAFRNCRKGARSGNCSQDDNHSVQLASMLIEVVSRFCCKCSEETKINILNFIKELYGLPEKEKYRNAKHLVRRVLCSMTEAEQYKLIPDLLEITFPESLIDTNECCNPFLFLQVIEKPTNAPRIEIQSERIALLVEQATSTDAKRRRWAIGTLAKLHELGLLDDDQTKKFAEAVWNSVDQYDLPKDTDFYKFAFLKIPHPESVEPDKRFRGYVDNQEFPRKIVSNVISGGVDRMISEIIGANSMDQSFWTREDAENFLRRIITWWDNGSKTMSLNMAEGKSIFEDELTLKIEETVNLFSEVVAPKLCSDPSDDIKADIERLLNELEERRIGVLNAKAACLHIWPDQKETLLEKIEEALNLNQNQKEQDALMGLKKMILNANAEDEGAAEPEAIILLGRYLMWHSKHFIVSALWIVVRILKDTPAKFSKTLECSTLGRLKRLLDETAYDKANPDLNFDEKVAARQAAAALAARLSEHYQAAGLPIPEAVEKWRVACLSPDEFAEIRNAWIDRVSA